MENGTDRQINQSSTAAPDELLAIALVGKSEEFKKRVWEYVDKSGLEPNDPLFLVLVATGRLEVLLEDAPNTLERLFKNWSKEILRNLEAVESAMIERQKLAISKAALELIKKSEKQHEETQEGRHWWKYILLLESSESRKSILSAAVLMTAILGLGFIMGMSIPPWLDGGLAEPKRLTVNQVDLLRWAESDEGRLARNLMEWNAGYLDTKECQQDAQSLKVRLVQGNRKAVSGFCILWTVPPSERKFEK